MALLLLFLFCGGALRCADTVPNIQNFEQLWGQKVAQTKSEVKRTIFPVLLVEFEDVKFSLEDPVRSFDAMLNGRDYSEAGAVGSVSQWLECNFAGKASFSFEVSEVISLQNPVSAYGAHSMLSNDSNVLQMVEDACGAASDTGVDFSRYDNDGDGMADNVAIIFAGYSQAEGGDPNSIWPHQQRIADLGLNYNGTGIASFMCNAELSGNSGATIAPIGHFCHEFSHFLGLPDLYDLNGEEEGIAPATYGSLSIMDRANFINSGNIPPMYNAVEREILGLCEIEDLLPDSTYTLSPYPVSDKIYRIASSNEGEYFLLECRNAAGWDAGLGGSGLLVYHVDKSSRIYGGMASADRWKFNNVNCYAPHECVRMISPSGPGCSAAGVFFPGTSGTGELLPQGGKMPLRDWAGHPVGIGLKDIDFSGGKVTFRTVGELAFDATLPRAVECRAIPYQSDMRVEWSSSVLQEDAGVEMEWLVKWREKDSDGGFSSMVTGEMMCYISGIAPGCAYEIQVCALDRNVFGESSRIHVKSIPVTSHFPYIHVDGKGYEEGDIMDLRLMNLVEKNVSVEWYANGMPVDGTSIRMEQGGEVRIMAVIKYSDGSDERIYKRIEVR